MSFKCPSKSFKAYSTRQTTIQRVETCSPRARADRELRRADSRGHRVSGGPAARQAGEGPLPAAPRGPVVLLHHRGDHTRGPGGALPLPQMGVPRSAAGAEGRPRSDSTRGT